MTLSDLSCRNSKPKTKAYRLYDGHGLYLDVMPTGRRVWRMKYRFEGKEKLLTIGHYPKVGLGSAREQRDNARQKIFDGEDPSFIKQQQKNHDLIKASQTFEFIAVEWHTRFYDTWDEKYAKHILSRLKSNVFPIIGKQPISTLTARQVFLCVQKMEERGKHDLARRVLQIIGQIIRYAVITGRAERDITTDLKGALKKYKRRHYLRGKLTR